MAKQFYFTVFYDNETDSFEIDYDTQEALFDNRPIFNTKTAGWEELEESHWSDPNADYARSADALYSVLKDLKTKED